MTDNLDKNPPKISVIIPCFNDGVRLVPIIDEVKQSPVVGEIIVIDDGSGHETKQILSKLKGICLLSRVKNQGKSQALLMGVEKSHSDTLLFIDSDLSNFSHLHINLLRSIYFKGNFDMLLGIREKEIWFFKWIGSALAFTGERILNKSILMDHLELFRAQGYLIEPALNELFFHDYKVGAVELKHLGQTYKIQKNGLAGLLADLKMFKDYLNYLGIKELIFQLRYIKRNIIQLRKNQLHLTDYDL